MKKNIISFILMTAVFSGFSVTAFSETVSIPDTDVSVELPEGAYCIDASEDYYEDIWEEAGIDDVYTEKTNAEEVSASLIFTRNNGEDKVYVSRKDSDDAALYWNLGELEKFADMYNSDSGSMLVESEIYRQDAVPFIKLDIESGLLIDNEVYYEEMYFTIVNGYSVSFRTVSSEGEISESAKEFLREITDSFTLTETIAKAESSVSPAAAWAILIAVAVGIAALFIVNKKQKERMRRENRELADRLAEYRLKKKEDLGEAYFINETTHTEEAIKEFSRFQTFRLNIIEPIISIILPLVAAVVSYVVGGTWWKTLLLAGFSVYSLSKLLTGPGNIEKALNRVYGKMKSTTAHYEFYEEEFTISGMQARGVFPYFQITRLEKNGNMVYIYFGEGTTYFVSGDGFSKGDLDGLTEFLMSRAKE